MYEELSKKLCDLSDMVLHSSETVQVSKWDLQQAYVAISKLGDKIKDLESQNAHLHRRVMMVMKENNQLAMDFCYLLQQVDGPPFCEDGLKVQLPDCFWPKNDDGCDWGTCYAVLHPERDEAAKAALYAYAANTDNAMIRHKILLWLGDQTEADEPKIASALDIITAALEARDRRLAWEKANPGKEYGCETA